MEQDLGQEQWGGGRVSDATGLSQAEPVSRLGPSGFDPSRAQRPGFFERLAQFKEALFVSRTISERVLSGQQFNCYEAASNDEDEDPEYWEYRLCVGPVTNAYFICDLTGKDDAELIEAALKVATEAFLEHASAMSAREGQDPQGLGAKPASAAPQEDAQ